MTNKLPVSGCVKVTYIPDDSVDYSTATRIESLDAASPVGGLPPASDLSGEERRAPWERRSAWSGIGWPSRVGTGERAAINGTTGELTAGAGTDERVGLVARSWL